MLSCLSKLLPLLLAGPLLLAQPADSSQAGPPFAVKADSLPAAKLDIGYGQQSPATISSAMATLGAEDFNQGLISDPVQLIQGKVAGLQAYNRGGDPNRAFLMSLRGASLGANPVPLIVIDGIIGGDLDNVDPNDIERISVLKDVAATAIYGHQASAGAILIHTKTGKPARQGLRVEYHGQGAAAQLQGRVPVMDAAQFRAAGGVDFGAATDWQEEIARTAWSQAHGLALSEASDNFSFRLSANYRDVQGVLLNSGFTQFNTRLQLSARGMNDRLGIQLQGAYTNRSSDYSIPEAFRYATTFNPTAPVLGSEAPFPFDSERYGGYFETLGLFDSFNPVSMLEQSSHAGQRNSYTLGVHADYAITEHLSLNGRWAKQSAEGKQRAYYPVTALFRGNASSVTRQGRADYLSNAYGFDLYEAFAAYENKGLSLLAGYSRQAFSGESQGASFEDFANSTYDFNGSLDPPPGQGPEQLLSAFRTLRPEDNLDALFARAAVDMQQGWFASLAVRRETSSLFEGDAAKVFNWALSTGLDLNRLIKLEQADYFKLRASYGRTGSLPPIGSQARTRTVIAPNPGTTIISNAPNITTEQQSELNVGLDFAGPRLQASLDVYQRRTEDLIVVRLSDPVFGVGPTYGNGGQLRTRGAELTLGYSLIEKEQIKWNTGLVLSTYKSVLESYFVRQEMRANPGSPGQGGTNLVIVQEGEELGQLWGPVFAGAGPDGLPIFEDINGDGRVLAESSDALSADADFRVLGKGRPSLELGWSNQLSLGSWSLNAFFRAAVGHSLVNTFRAFYEPRALTPSSYNYVDTDLAVEGLAFTRFSSLYVERADFLKLDNLTLAKRFALKGPEKHLTLSLTGQNILLWTNYTGVDPEPALVDYGSTSNGSYVDYNTPDYASPGIDRRHGYRPAWSAVLGARLEW